MATRMLPLERSTLHGHFSRDLMPVLTIESGDTVLFQTLDAGWNLEPPPLDASLGPTKFSPRDPDLDRGHALCGPIALRGAEPGMTLAVHIDAIVPGDWGWNIAGGWSSRINDRLGIANAPEHRRQWTLDSAAGIAHDQDGFVVPMRPFMGVMGVAPATPGVHATTPPRPTGGNIDCKELIVGSTLFLPIAVPGALFSTGDGHAAQGDGELSQLAIECPMRQVALTFELLPDRALTMPRATTPAGQITFGFDEDLHTAAMIALEDMLALMGEEVDLGRQAALALASVAVDLHITQLVNGGVLGVHAILPHGALRRL